MEPSTSIHAASLSTSRFTSGAAPIAPTAPTELSDAELLTATRGLVGRSNQLLASLLAHLGEVEARGIHRTLDPLPRVPPRIEPLGPASSRPAPAAATWSQFMNALNPVRELEPGARPRDWTGSAACDWVERTEGAPFANDGSRAARLEQDANATPTVSALARSDTEAMPTVSALALETPRRKSINFDRLREGVVMHA